MVFEHASAHASPRHDPAKRERLTTARPVLRRRDHPGPGPHPSGAAETDDAMSLGVEVNGVGDPFALDSVELDRDLAPQELSAYARLILGVLEGDPTFSIRGDEAEESWRIVEPILDAWGAGRVPLGTYPAGAANPVGMTD